MDTALKMMGEAFQQSAVPNFNTQYISGDVVSRETFRYGRYVSKVFTPNKKGTTTGFFTMYAGPDMTANWNSIEIELVPSVDAHPVSLDLSYGDGSKRIQYQTYHDFQFGDQWHTYSFDWTPDYVSFSIDGQELKRYEGDHPGVVQQFREQNIEMNYWSTRSDEHPPEDWHAGFEDADMPWSALYDYVEMYDYNEITKDFELRWRDDFDQGYLDTNRWAVQDNKGWDTNLSTFMASQVSVTQDGYLALTMAKNPYYMAPDLFLQ